MAFVVAFIVLLLTVFASGLVLFAQGMGDAADTHTPPVYTVLIAGVVIALAIAGSHWLPHSW
jgi:hypothetical protein